MRIIYSVRNQINGKIYVGQTNNLAQRKTAHFYAASVGDQRKLYCDIREHGKANFIFDVLEECDDSIAPEREQHWITHFDSFNNGYNLTSGGGYHVGNRGRKFTDEHKRKLSESCKGKVRSEESRRRISEAAKSRPQQSEATRLKRSQALSGSKNPNFGKRLPEETRRKISEALKGRKKN